jgi:hypothetical protein
MNIRQNVKFKSLLRKENIFLVFEEKKRRN